jgi:transposase
MYEKLVNLPGKHKRLLRRRARKSKDADYRIRCLIILKLAEGDSTGEAAQQLEVVRSTASRVASRYREEGIAGLLDHRMFNGQGKVYLVHLQWLEYLLQLSPQDCGWQRTTWTRELLARQLKADTQIELTAVHIGRLLRQLGAKWKRARPVVLCPWPRRKRLLNLAKIRRMVRTLPAEEIAFYVDEMDVHLNPRIGPDWMSRGVQKRIVTPGQNQKAYLAGALNASSGKLTWHIGSSKNSDLFIEQVRRLSRKYHRYEKIHLILDNFIIHSSRKTKRAIAELGGHVELHFLPPYCQEENRIERVWREVHANVTRNHKCRTMNSLLGQVDDCMHALSPFPGSKASLRRAS